MVALALLAYGGAGCRRSAERYVPIQRLGAAQPEGSSSRPLARVAGQHRPALSSASEVRVLRDVTPAIAATGHLDVAIPAALRGSALCVAGSLRPDQDATRLYPLASAPVPSAGATVQVELPADASIYPAFVDLRARVPSTPRHEIPLPTVPPGARLRFAIGLEEHPLVADEAPARFRLVLADADGEHELFAAELAPAERARDRRWQEHEVDLAAYAGRAVRLRFEAEATSTSDCRTTASPVWSAPTIVAPRSRPLPPPPNLLLISLDTLRADRLGAYGYAKPTSPTLDHVIAASGTVFTRAYSAYPSTCGSHMTMLTSLAPCVHKVVEVSDPPLRADARTLAELLRDAEYATAAFTEDGQVTSRTGIARGFDLWVEQHALEHGNAAVTFRHTRDWIRHHRSEPWFVFAHTYEVHEPYTPPPGYREMLDPADTPSNRYDGEIRYTDDLLARLFDKLRRARLLDRTLVVVTSDHGEQFGEHGLQSHSNSVYDVLLHVPMLLRAPGLVPAGLRVDQPVGLVDLVPTVLELLGLPPSPLAQGRSLVPLLHGRPLPPRPLFAENRGTDLAVHVDDARMVKLIFRNRVVQHAYLLASDPGEEHDAFAEARPEAVADATRAFDAYCAAVPPPAAIPAPGAPVDPGVAEKLKALGYAR
jgi:arylsulfatase A-like enzyme